MIKYVNGLVVLINIAWVPLVAPTIVSPFTKVPLIPVAENCGNLGSAFALSDSNTACNLNTSPLPKDISLCLASAP